MRARRLWWALALLCATGGAARAVDPGPPGVAPTAAAPAPDAAPAPVQVTVRAEPDTVTIGSRFRVTVEITAAPGTEILFAQPAERLGEFDIVDFGDAPAAHRDGRVVVSRWFTLTGFEPGHKIVPAPPVQYRLPGEALAAAPEAHVVVSVESLLAKEPEAADIRGIRGPEPVPWDWRPPAVVGGALATVILLALLARWLWRRRRRVVSAPPPRPAHEVAREALAALRRAGLVERGEFKPFYSTLSGIVRAYLEQRYGLRAPEMTTEEFLQATAQGTQLGRTHRTLLGDFLAEADLVKFARHLPALADTERAFGAAERFVDETAPAAITEPTRAAG